MNTKVLIQTIVFLSTFISFSNSLDCDCYDVSEPAIETNGDVTCFSYLVTTDTSSDCEANGTLRILFGAERELCTPSQLEISDLFLNSTDPEVTIHNSDQPGYQFIITESSQNIEICLYGIHQTGNGVLLFTDDSTSECKFTSTIVPDFCGGCDSDEIATCCGYTTSSECELGERPTGNTECGWISGDEVCAMFFASECFDLPPNTDEACICFLDEFQCDLAATEGELACDWSDDRDECVPNECVDQFSCSCYETEQDCINADDEPTACEWNGVNCTECVDVCSCYNTREVCENVVDLACIWIDECVDIFTSTEFEFDSLESTAMETSTTSTSTTTTTTSTTTTSTSTSTTEESDDDTPEPTPTTTYWRKPTPPPSKTWSKKPTSSGTWDKGNKGKKGQKGGKP